MNKILLTLALFSVAIVLARPMQLTKIMQSKFDAGSVCQSLQKDLPNCNFLECDNEVIDFICPFDVFQQNFSVGVGINICATPVNINFTFYENGSDIYQTQIDGSIEFGIPGLSIDIYDLVDAGVNIDITMDTSSDEFDLLIGTQACVGAIGYNLCWPNPAFTIIDIEVPVQGFCNGTKSF